MLTSISWFFFSFRNSSEKFSWGKKYFFFEGWLINENYKNNNTGNKSDSNDYENKGIDSNTWSDENDNENYCNNDLHKNNNTGNILKIKNKR